MKAYADHREKYPSFTFNIKMAVLGDLSPSMLYLLFTIFNGAHKLSLRPYETYPGDKDFSQFS